MGSFNFCLREGMLIKGALIRDQVLIRGGGAHWEDKNPKFKQSTFYKN